MYTYSSETTSKKLSKKANSGESSQVYEFDDVKLQYVSGDTDVIQRVELSEAQVKSMVMEHLKRFNVQNFIREYYYYLEKNWEEYDDVKCFIQNILLNTICQGVSSYSHGEEIKKNTDNLTRYFNEIMIERYPRMYAFIQEELSSSESDEQLEVTIETGSSTSMEVTYENAKLKKFVENDPNICQTIENIQTHGGGGGTAQSMRVGGYKVYHKHITGGTAIAYTIKEGKIHICGYGTKSDSAPNGSGGYDWDTKPK